VGRAIAVHRLSHLRFAGLSVSHFFGNPRLKLRTPKAPASAKLESRYYSGSGKPVHRTLSYLKEVCDLIQGQYFIAHDFILAYAFSGGIVLTLAAMYNHT